MRRTLLISALLATPALLPAASDQCPAYPAEKRQALLSSFALERAAAALAPKSTTAPRQAVGNNLIDDHVFAKLDAARVQPAPRSDDATFLRRATLDLTGRIPTLDQARAFLADSSPGKRQALIDSLISSPSYIDYWTWWFANQFQVTSGYYNIVGIPGRNLFHNYLRDFLRRDRSYRDVAAELIAAAGDSHESGPPNFILRAMQLGDPLQDTWDTLTNDITTTFLGIQTQCISCHDGRRHLEQINLDLTSRRRTEFYGQAAFLSRMKIAQFSVDSFGQQTHSIVLDLGHGVYEGSVSATNPGQRPPRIGSHQPAYIFTGEKPGSGEWRQELARMVTGDRQFARATVNYLWTHFFRTGIVDPPDGWDLARIDPSKPPPAPWTLQPSHPELIEALADRFIAGNYSVRAIIRLIVESEAYQLSSRYPGAWRPEYARLLARHTPRRLSAEEIWNALTASTMTEVPMFVEGFAEPLLHATQLPDPTEPRQDARIRTFLANYGRGDWWRLPRDSQSSVVQVLYFMNDATINARTFGPKLGGGTGETRVARLLASPLADPDCIDELYLATLGRMPTDAERTGSARPPGVSREDWLSDLQWALLNKVEFIFNN